MRPQSASAIRIHGHGLPFHPPRHASNDPRMRTMQAARHATHRYELAIVVTDFIDTSEAFHRALIHIARTSAVHIGLLQQTHGGKACGTDDSTCCDEILLEGLRWRLGFSEDECTIVTGRTFLPVWGDTLIIHGRTAEWLPAALHPLSHAPGARSDLIIVQDEPDLDCDIWGDATS